FPFNYADLTMASTAEALLENAVDYLMQLECPVGNGRSVSEFPQHFELLPNYPNPFNPETVVSYRLSVVSDVKLAIYNVLGELVRNLHQRRETPGLHSVRWDGRDDAGRPVCSGVYIYRLETAQQTATRKMILLR
ncbi:MAG: T9SS type A sorting domain-containing protein, partial [Calditrichaeota bacterium]|nr:T9SS type A sorting domain-containing protein [Calditrichota bacterium]